MKPEIEEVVSTDNILPLDLCRDILITHALYDHCYTFLSQKQQYKGLTELLRERIQGTKDSEKKYHMRQAVKHFQKINGKVQSQFLIKYFHRYDIRLHGGP